MILTEFQVIKIELLSERNANGVEASKDPASPGAPLVSHGLHLANLQAIGTIRHHQSIGSGGLQPYMISIYLSIDIYIALFQNNAQSALQ